MGRGFIGVGFVIFHPLLIPWVGNGKSLKIDGCLMVEDTHEASYELSFQSCATILGWMIVLMMAATL